MIVPKGIWSYPDPARIVADRFGAPRPHGPGRGRDPAAVAVHARGRPHRRRRCRRGPRRRGRGEVPRAARPDRGHDRARDRAGRDHARRAGRPPRRDHQPGRDPPRPRGAGTAVRGDGDRVAGRHRHERRRAPAGAGRAPVGVQPRRRGQPGRLGPHRPLPRRPRTVAGEPGRRPPVHEAALLAVERRPRGGPHPVLGRDRDPPRHPARPLGVPGGGGRVEHDDPADGAGRAAPVARVRARRRAGCSRRPAPPSTTSPTSTSTAASRRPCASRRASWAWRTDGRSP